MTWWRGIVAIMARDSSLRDMRHRADVTMVVCMGDLTTADVSTHNRHNAADHTPH